MGATHFCSSAEIAVRYIENLSAGDLLTVGEGEGKRLYRVPDRADLWEVQLRIAGDARRKTQPQPYIAAPTTDAVTASGRAIMQRYQGMKQAMERELERIGPIKALPQSGPALDGAPDQFAVHPTERAAAAERSRILAAIQALKPPHRPKTNGDWARAWKESGELAMWERVIKAIGGE